MDYNLLTVPVITFLLRITCVIVGFFIIKLGYNLILKGISGDFKFSSEYKGIKGGLVSSSPGLLFVFMGALVIIAGVAIDRPFSYSDKIKSIESHMNMQDR